MFAPQIAFLDRMAICFFAVIAVLTVMTWLNPLQKPVDLPVNPAMDMRSSRGAMAFGGIVICLTAGLYLLFW